MITIDEVGDDVNVKLFLPFFFVPFEVNKRWSMSVLIKRIAVLKADDIYFVPKYLTLLRRRNFIRAAGTSEPK